MFSSDRQTHRQTFIDAWSKSRSNQPLEPLEAQIVQILEMHPEYHGLLEDPDSVLDRDWLPDGDETNPFLHLGLHMAVLEQISMDRPEGICRLHKNLVAAAGDVHEADHRVMDCLLEALWRVQHEDRSFNDNAYLKCVGRAGGGLRPVT